MGDLSYIERGQITGARVGGASVTKPAELLGASRATVSKVLSAYTNHDKTTSARRNSGRKLTLTERDRRIFRRIVSKNHTTTAAQRQQSLIFILKTLFPQKLSDVMRASQIQHPR
jgi:predicted transcriptional regulator